jgi:murein DD-endopeptidase MepM/ murein hydrolase activator NlpD
MSTPTREGFRRALAGTPMAREADGIYDAAMRGGINPALVVGIAGAESNFGRLGYARGRNNPYGLMGFRFGNYTQATQKLAQTLNNKGLGYRSAYGRSGLNGMIQIYTPRGAANGPNNDPDGHTRNIINIGRKTGGDPSKAYITPGAAPAAAAPTTGTVAGGLQSSVLMDLMRKQTQRIRSGQGYDTALGKQIRDTVIGQIGKNNIGGGNVDPTDAPITAGGSQPRLSKWGGPEDHGSRALGNWESDLAYDLGGPTGTAIRSPLPGRVVKVGGQPGGRPQFAGYGVTVDYGGGRQAFFKHLGTLGPGIRAGARIPRGALLGGLDAKTGGGPHLHLGATNRGFLQSLLSYYGAG